jgi:hypothetical protein
MIPCFTPIRSPESNGMAEAFVKTFKRDYVYLHDRPGARTVLAQIHEWFEDYNEVHPHKGKWSGQEVNHLGEKHLAGTHRRASEAGLQRGR